MTKITKDALLALLAQMEEDEENEVPAMGTGTHFASLGYVAVGKGSDPGEGAIIEVPTKAGKLARVKTIQRINVAPFNLGDRDGDWAYTYKRLKRGEK